jgi:hypothetical protein
MQTIVMAGLAPAIHGSVEPVVKVFPICISREYQAHLSGPRPMLHVALALDRSADVRVTLCEHQPLQPVSLSKSVGQTFPVLPNATSQIAGNPYVQRAVWPVSYDVNPCAFHVPNPG